MARVARAIATAKIGCGLEEGDDEGSKSNGDGDEGGDDEDEGVEEGDEDEEGDAHMRSLRIWTPPLSLSSKRSANLEYKLSMVKGAR
jgi:hypothetical protein